MNNARHNTELKAPQEAILDLPQERITGDILRGRGPRRGNLERLIRYWRPIMRKPGGFRRCLVILADHPELYPLERICAWLHHETTGLWPNEGNHHAGGKLGPVKRNFRRARFPRVRGRRKKKGVNADYMRLGVDIPLDRISRRIGRERKSQMYAPLDGTIVQLEWKASRVGRALESIVLPGERGSTNPRHLALTALTPGGSGLPGPKIRPRLRTGAGRVAGGRTPRGFRCPPGFEKGGHFTDASFSTCGRQLFGIPGTNRVGLRTIADAVAGGGSTTGRSRGQGAAFGTRQRTRGVPLLPEEVGRPNFEAQEENTSKVIESIAKADTDVSVRRLIREDGSILVPTAPLDIISKQVKDNPDLRNANFVQKVPAATESFGADALDLFPTGISSITYVLPGGGTVALVRNNPEPMTPGQARSFGKAAANARKVDLPDGDLAGVLRETAARTDSVTFEVEIPGERADVNKLVRVERNGAVRRVPLWVFRTFLAQNAPGRTDGEEPYTLITGQKNLALAEQRWGQFVETKARSATHGGQWGPLQYTAAPIPPPGNDFYQTIVEYKTSSFRSAQIDGTEKFEEKRARAVFDIGISRFRCPPGTENAGQITNRLGIGCGASIARRLLGAGRNVANVVSDPTDTGNVPIPTARQPKPRKRSRTRALLERLANVFDPDRQVTVGTGSSGFGVVNAIENVISADAVDIPNQENPVGNVLQRISQVFTPSELIREDRPFRTRRETMFDVLNGKDETGYLGLLAGNEIDSIEDTWKRRMDSGAFDVGEARKYLASTRAEIDVNEFARLEDELIDYDILKKMQDSPLDEAVVESDQLTDDRWGRIVEAYRKEQKMRQQLSDTARAERAAKQHRENAAKQIAKVKVAAAKQRQSFLAAHKRIIDGDGTEEDINLLELTRQNLSSGLVTADSQINLHLDELDKIPEDDIAQRAFHAESIRSLEEARTRSNENLEQLDELLDTDEYQNALDRLLNVGDPEPDIPEDAIVEDVTDVPETDVTEKKPSSPPLGKEVVLAKVGFAGVNEEPGSFAGKKYYNYLNPDDLAGIHHAANSEAERLEFEDLLQKSDEWSRINEKHQDLWKQLVNAADGDEEIELLKANGYKDLTDFLFDMRESEIKRWVYHGERRRRNAKTKKKMQPWFLAQQHDEKSLQAEIDNLELQTQSTIQEANDAQYRGHLSRWSDLLKTQQIYQDRIEAFSEALAILQSPKKTDDTNSALNVATTIPTTDTASIIARVDDLGTIASPEGKTVLKGLPTPKSLDGADGNFSVLAYAKERYDSAINVSQMGDADFRSAANKKFEEIQKRLAALNADIDAAETEAAKDILRNGEEAQKLRIQILAYQFALDRKQAYTEVLAEFEGAKDFSLPKLLAMQQKLEAQKAQPLPGFDELQDGETLEDRLKSQFAAAMNVGLGPVLKTVVDGQISKKKAALKEAHDNYVASNKTQAKLKDPAAHLIPPQDDGNLGFLDTIDGIVGQEESVQHLANGGEITHIAPGWIRDAILENTGDGKRFRRISSGSSINSIKGGQDHETVVVQDIEDPLGRKYVLKRPMRDDREYIREQAAQVLMQKLGLPSSSILVDGEQYEFINPDYKGITTNRSMILEHTDNIVDMAKAHGNEPADMDALARLVLLDALMGEFDRHSENWVPYKTPEGKRMLYPIDHGKSFTPWDETKAGKPDPLFYHATGQLAFSAITSTDEKRQFARRLRKALKDFDSDDFAKQVRKAMETQGFDADEQEFADTLTEFVANRVPQLRNQLEEYISDLPGGDITPNKKLPQSATVANKPQTVAAKIDGINTEGELPAAYFAYDGGEIKDAKVRARRVGFARYDGTGEKVGQAKSKATELSFKLRNEALFKLVDEATTGDGNGWTYETRMSIPMPSKSFWDFQIGFTTQGTFKIHEQGLTLRKELDDGTVIYVYSAYKGKASSGGFGKDHHGINSFSGMVRIVSPQAPKTAMKPSAIKAWMAEAGVKTHGIPGPDELEEMAGSKMAASLLGPMRVESLGGTSKALEFIKSTYGVSVDDLEISIDSTGNVIAVLPEDSMENVAALSEGAYTVHHKWNSSEATPEKLASWVQNGLMPTTDRWMSAVDENGQSSHKDVSHNGSGEYVFTYMHKGGHEEEIYERLLNGDASDFVHQHSKKYAVVFGPERFRQLGFRLTRYDVYGNPTKGIDIDYGLSGAAGGDSGTIQMLFKGTQKLTKADRIIIRDFELFRQTMELLEERGIYEIDGVPLEKIILRGGV